jgi:hypothetical protein
MTEWQPSEEVCNKVDAGLQWYGLIEQWIETGDDWMAAATSVQALMGDSDPLELLLTAIDWGAAFAERLAKDSGMTPAEWIDRQRSFLLADLTEPF